MVKPSGQALTLMDIGVYEKDQNLKLINQSKMRYGGQFSMKNDGIDPIDSLVRLYYGVGDCVRLSYNASVGLTKAKAKTTTGVTRNRATKTEAAIETDVIELSEASGVTLMQQTGVTYDQICKYPEWKQYLYLIPNTAQALPVFKYVGFALRNAGATLDDYKQWAQLSLKYTRGEQVDRFATFLTGTRAFGLPLLKALAKKAHPGYFDVGLAMLNEYFKLDYRGIRIIEEDCEFVSMDSNNILSVEKLLILIARLGGGKTQGIKRIIKENNYKRILFISPRISFAQFVASHKEFDLTLYNDEGADFHSDRIVVSVESLWKLKHYEVKAYDLVVLDESEANLSVFSSSTCKKQLEVYQYLIELIQNSKQTVYAGAFITQKTIAYVASFELPTVCLRNTHSPIQKRAIEYHDDVFILKLKESIQRGEKNYVCYCSLRQMKDDIAVLKGCVDSVVQEIVNDPTKWLTYSSEGDDVLQKESLQEIGNDHTHDYCW